MVEKREVVKRHPSQSTRVRVSASLDYALRAMVELAAVDTSRPGG